MKHTIQIALTAEYWNKITSLKEEKMLNGHRSWLVPEEAQCDHGEISFCDTEVILSYQGKNGNIQKGCPYGSVAAYEQKDGILLSLSKKRYLFLPASSDRTYNTALADILLLLRRKCRFVFRKGNLRLPGISLGKKATLFFSRSPTVAKNAEPFSLVASIVTVILCLFMSGIFMYMPIDNREIQKEEAIQMTGHYQSLDVRYKRGNIHSLRIELSNENKQFVHSSCTTKALADQLSQLPKNAEITLLIHPSSNNVLEIETEGEILLDFDTAQSRLTGNATGFFVLGAFLLIAAIYLSYIWFFKR